MGVFELRPCAVNGPDLALPSVCVVILVPYIYILHKTEFIQQIVCLGLSHHYFHVSAGLDLVKKQIARKGFLSNGESRIKVSKMAPF